MLEPTVQTVSAVIILAKDQQNQTELLGFGLILQILAQILSRYKCFFCFLAALTLQRVFQSLGFQYLSMTHRAKPNVGSHCHVNCGSDTYFEGKLQRMLIVEVKRGLNQPRHTSLFGASGMFVFTHSERRDQLNKGSYLKSNKPQTKKKRNNTAPAFLTLSTWQNEILCLFPPAHQHCCVFLRMPLTACATQSLGQPHFASSEYL